MAEIKLTQGKVAIVDDADYEWLSQFKWCLTAGKYAGRCINGNVVLMHRIINKTPEGVWTDHINENKLDNRRSNLRDCTSAQNKANVTRRKDNTSGFKGVAVFRKKWQAYINKDGKRIHLGHFEKKEDAARAYNEAAVDIFGEFARLNNV